MCRTGIVANWSSTAIDEVVAVVLPLEADDPASVGPYALRGRLGAGGMGRVYLSHTRGGRAIALKIVRSELADDPEFRLRFRREVAAARQVHGMFTAEVVDADPDANPPWLATVYVPGPSLSEAVRTNGPLPESSVWLLLAGIAEALLAVHAVGVIHRDLKPANVILAADGPKVIDFGIARTRDVTQVTRTGLNVGSPQYMAPEHVLGRDLTDAVDVFSLGGVGVYAATGHSPFGDGPDVAVLYRVVNEQPDLTGIDGHLRALLATCLAKDPEQRPSPTQVLQACHEAAGAHPVRIDQGWLPESLRHETTGHATDLPPTAVQPTPPPRPPRRRTMPWLAGAGVAVLGAVLAVVWLLHGFGDNRQPATNPPPATGHGPTSPSGATTPKLLGAPNFDGYCRATGQGPVELITGTAYGWHCTNDNGKGDDADSVCAWTYHTAPVTTRVQDFYQPNSWQCWRASRNLGPLDWVTYCRDLGYPGAQNDPAAQAYGWTCVDDATAVDPQAACLRLYDSNPPISRFQNFADPNSWQCWG